MDCSPYALLTTNGTLCALAIFETAGTSSGTRGAKVLVVTAMQRMFSAPCSFTAASIASTFVVTSSPLMTPSTTIGVRPAVSSALKHDFWSQRCQIAKRAAGRVWRSCNRTMLNDMPVARGMITHDFRFRMPQIPRT